MTAVGPVEGTISLATAADLIECAPAAIYQAARRIGVDLPRVNHGRVVLERDLAAIRAEITRYRFDHRTVVQVGRGKGPA